MPTQARHLLFLLAALFLLLAFQKLENNGGSGPEKNHFAVNSTTSFREDSIRAGEILEEARKTMRGPQPGSARGKMKEAIEHYEQLTEQSSDSMIWSHYLTALFDWAQLNSLYYQDLQEALETFKRGYDLTLKRFGEEHPGLSFFITKIGHIHADMGDFETAVLYHRRAFEHRKKYLAKEEFFHYAGYSNLINGLRGQGRYDEALKYLDTAALLVKKYHPENEIDILRGYALTYKEMGKLDTALKYLDKALAIAEEEGKMPGRGWIHLLKGVAYSDKEDSKLARENYLQALKLLEPYYGSGHPSLNQIYGRLTSVYMEERDHKSAIHYMQLGLQSVAPHLKVTDWRNNPLPGSIQESAIGLCAIYQKAMILSEVGQQRKDTSMLRFALVTFELLFSQAGLVMQQYKEEKTKLNYCEAQSHWAEGAIETALHLYYTTQDSAYLNEAYQYSEKAKAYNLIRQIKNAQAREEARVPDSLKKIEIHIRQSIKEVQKELLEQQLESGKVITQRSQKLRVELFALQQQRDSFILANQAKYPHYWRQRQSIFPPSLSEVQQKLQAEEEMIHFYYGTDSIYLFGIRPDAVQFEAVGLDTVLLQAIERMKNGIKGDSLMTPANFMEDGHAVYMALVAPLLGTRQPKRLHVIPDGPLNFIPFEILLTHLPPAEEKRHFRNLPYLFRNIPISYEYSGALFLEQNEKKEKIGRYLGLAPAYASVRKDAQPVPDELYSRFVLRNARSEAGPLKHNVPEVLAVREELSGTALAGPEATEEVFKEQAGQYDIIHLAMHGFTSDLDPDYSGLLFSNQDTNRITKEDGFLHAYEITGLRLKAQLAVLSACNTGAGRLQRGEGVMSLARAFKYAGCPNVLMSLWQVDDASTNELITAFFKNLKKGMHKDEALQMAKLDFLATTKNDHLTHPYYWAGFVLVGNDAPLQFTRPLWQSWLWLAGIATVLIFAFFFWKLNTTD